MSVAMNSLFWRIFISFWLALLLFVGSTLWLASNYVEKLNARQESITPLAELPNYLIAAQQIADTNQVSSLRDWLKQIDRNEVIPLYLIDPQGNDLLGRAVPAYIAQKAVRFAERREQGNARYRKLLSKRGITLGNDEILQLIPDYRGATLDRILVRPRSITIPIFLATLISGIVCFLLARYLTAPVQRLRSAARRMAQGDLEVRVSQSLGQRNDEIMALARDFDTMADRLQEMLAAHKQLLRDASHELRSPIARLQLALGLARQRSAHKTDSDLDRIEVAIEQLNELIDQLLTLSKLESGSMVIQHEPVNLAELLQFIADDAVFEARQQGKKVNLTVDDVPDINGDERLLHSAIENIVRNAIRHTRADSAVEIRLARDLQTQYQIVISIRDFGPGIPAEALHKVFDPFVRLGDARDRQSGGYGLGLAIAKQSVELHGGHIAVSNTDGDGVLFDIYLPVLRHAE